MKEKIQQLKRWFYKYLISILLVGYIGVIFVGGIFLYYGQTNILVSEEVNIKKDISQYKEYFKSNSKVWYNGKMLSIDSVSEEIIQKIVNCNVSINTYERGFSADTQNAGLKFSVSIPFSTNTPVFSAVEYTGKFQESLENWIQLGDFVAYKSDLSNIGEEYALFYSELFLTEFDTFTISFCEEDVLEMRQYDIITGETIKDTGNKECLKVTITFESREEGINLYLLIDKRAIGDVYMDVINNLHTNKTVCKLNGEIPVYELDYVVSNGQKDTLTCNILGKDFLYTLLQNNSLYNDAICTYVPEKNSFSFSECLYISTMYATTTGYDGITLNSDCLRAVVMLETVIANSIILAIIVSFLTDFLFEKKGKYEKSK